MQDFVKNEFFDKKLDFWTVLENHWKSRIQHYKQSELRLQFE